MELVINPYNRAQAFRIAIFYSSSFVKGTNAMLLAGNHRLSFLYYSYRVEIKGMYLNSPTSSVSLGSFSDARRKSLNDRFVPEAEVNLGILNVGFGEFTTGEYR
jgi:hypothetical protein